MTATVQRHGLVCQSCGMPLLAREDFGTDAHGSAVEHYCRHCLAGGAFTAPCISMQDMIEHSVAVMTQQGIMPDADARTLLGELLPRLKRWREARRGYFTPA